MVADDLEAVRVLRVRLLWEADRREKAQERKKSGKANP